MTRIKKLTIKGFRGILTPLELELDGKSLVILGQNGSGKSSVTDAWEWLVTGRIEHLGKEGAGPQSYPHIRAGSGEVWVEVQIDSGIGTLRRTFDHDRITKPKESGNFEALQALAPHPCHVRFADLSRFVYFSKSERYDSLALLMGFADQVEAQKALRRVQRQFRDHGIALEGKLKELRTRAVQKLGTDCGSFKDVAAVLDPALKRRALPAPTRVAELQDAAAKARDLVASDPAATRLVADRQLATALGRLGSLSKLVTPVEEYLKVTKPFKELADQLKGILLVALLEQGLESLESQADPATCPLCGRAFGSDLREHVRSELTTLRAVKEAHDASATALAAAVTAVRDTKLGVDALDDASNLHPDAAVQRAANEISALARDGAEGVKELLGLFPRAAKDTDSDTLRDVGEKLNEIISLETRWSDAVRRLQSDLSASIETNESSTARSELVADLELFVAAADLVPQIVAADTALSLAAATAAELDGEVETFVTACVADVEGRFAEISADVADCFAILEEATPGLEKPVLKILSDQDRAVVLEVTLHSHSISPAYKYLSESQLNSFGLAVFLASVRKFNPKFDLIVLDDVVNSLDGFKRPLLIKLLKSKFADRQVILLTHDASWRDRLVRELPSWKKLHFRRNDPAVGPVVAQLKPVLDRVRKHIDDDEPKEAGQLLGPLMEDELQDVAEALHAEMRFNRRNEYTLDPLLACVRKRLDEKLKADHPASHSARVLYEEAGFRNLCAHAKNPSIDLTAQELRLALDAWIALVSQLRCSVATCTDLVRWIGPTFKCGCGATELKRG